MISVRNISKIFPITPVNPFRRAERVVALDGISLEAASGEVVAVIGRNGAGKTTLMKILCGLFAPDSGSASVCGFDCVSSRREVLRRTGLVTGGERSLYWRLSGRDNLVLFGALHDVPAARLPAMVDEILDSVGLTERAGAPVRTYSSGMRQRLSLARALLHEPEVLLLDEPTKGVDPALQGWLTRMIRDDIAQRKNKTVLYATHNMDEAVSFGGRVIVIEKGRAAWEGVPRSTEELRRIFDDVVSVKKPE